MFWTASEYNGGGVLNCLDANRLVLTEDALGEIVLVELTSSEPHSSDLYADVRVAGVGGGGALGSESNRSYLLLDVCVEVVLV